MNPKGLLWNFFFLVWFHKYTSFGKFFSFKLKIHLTKKSFRTVRFFCIYFSCLMMMIDTHTHKHKPNLSLDIDYEKLWPCVYWIFFSFFLSTECHQYHYNFESLWPCYKCKKNKNSHGYNSIDGILYFYGKIFVHLFHIVNTCQKMTTNNIVII